MLSEPVNSEKSDPPYCTILRYDVTIQSYCAMVTVRSLLYDVNLKC